MPKKPKTTETSGKIGKANLSAETPAIATTIPLALKEFLDKPAARKGFVNSKAISAADMRKRLLDLNVKPTVNLDRFVASANRINPEPDVPESKRPEELRGSIRALKPEARRFHGAKLALSWFPFPVLVSSCADRFGYMSPPSIRAATKLPFNVSNQALLGQLGGMMGDPGRDPNPNSHDPTLPGVSTIPAGFTYFGQFVDHDITFDISSSLDVATDANTIHNMRSPSLDLDSVYARGPGLDPFLYSFPSSGPATAIKFQLGINTNVGPGGPSSTGTPAGMVTQTDFDVPRTSASQTAIIGDPRNDENLIVVQFHHAMLRFHNAVVDLLVAASFTGDIFAEAKRIVTHHYQWAVVHDFLKRICGAPAVNNALASVVASIGSSFRMPVEFSVAAYRFGHSMIRDTYFVNFNFPNATLGQVFEFNRVPRLPVFSNWVVDFNAFFDTGIGVPVQNKARKIDSFMAAGLELLPGLTGLLAILATRNLRRGLALGLPSGQGMATHFGITPMTVAQLTSGLPANEVTLLNSNGGILLTKTPLWYYVLREAAVLAGGNQLGPVGARIVAETFVRILKRDASSFLNVSGGFVPILPSATPGDFTVADLVTFAGVTLP
ncbi:MAG: heme peroxidase family protein [Verrucomicrobiota bacterium]